MSGLDARLLMHTEDITHGVSELIRGAEREALLISPYISLDKLGWLERAIEDALDKKVAVTLVVRDEGSKIDQIEREAKELRQRGLRLLCVENLHAKAYWTEKSAILTSFNLLETSASRSIEVGMAMGPGPAHEQVRQFIDSQVLRRAQETPQRRRELERLADQEARRIKELEREAERQAKREEREKKLNALLSTAGSESSSKGSATHPIDRRNKSRDGYCIRCKDKIELDPNKPYCREDYASWAEFENEDYVDRFCHGCGKKHDATMRKPLCRDCYEELAT